MLRIINRLLEIAILLAFTTLFTFIFANLALDLLDYSKNITVKGALGINIFILWFCNVINLLSKGV